MLTNEEKRELSALRNLQGRVLSTYPQSTKDKFARLIELEIRNAQGQPVAAHDSAVVDALAEPLAGKQDWQRELERIHKLALIRKLDRGQDISEFERSRFEILKPLADLLHVVVSGQGYVMVPRVVLDMDVDFYGFPAGAYRMENGKWINRIGNCRYSVTTDELCTVIHARGNQLCREAGK
jgi:hypothetical protein